MHRNRDAGFPLINRGKVRSIWQRRLKRRLKAEGSLLALSRSFGMNVGYLSNVMNGHRPASRRLRDALRSFEDNALEYDAWKSKHAAELNAIVVWAEGRVVTC